MTILDCDQAAVEESMRNTLFESNWSQWFALPVIARGCLYASSGRVEGPDWIPTGVAEWEIQSMVKGRCDIWYGCCVRVATVDGKVLLAGECDCPVRRNCKHAAAALFAFVCCEYA